MFTTAIAKLGQTGALTRARRGLLGPHIMAFLPALSLIAFWTGGEALLLGVALGLPVLCALTGAFSDWARGEKDSGTQFADLMDGDEVRRLARSILVRARRGNCTTACFLVELEGLSALESRLGERGLQDLRDRLLHRLRATVRSGDRVTRIGDQRYALFLTPDRRMDLEGMLHLSRRLQNMAEEPLFQDRKPIFLAASVGFCLSSRIAKNAGGSALVDCAQDALQEALAHGPSAIRAYAPGSAPKRPDRNTLHAELSQALETGQVVAWFQPQICCNTGKLSGAEALARWVHPERGIVAPGQFLTALEEACLTERLADVMLDQTLAALTKWERAGLRLPRVSVNLAGDELRNPKLADRIRWELDRTDVAPDRLGIEVLETVIRGGADDVVARNLRILSDLGCQIDLDDFGTGDGSLEALRRFDITRLKIDRSFVTGLDRDARQRRMVAGILAMAETLGLETVAEGVESASEHALLAQLGCGHVQGFGLGRPMPAGQFVKWARAHRASLSAPKELRQGRG